jgi:hypothetical protein
MTSQVPDRLQQARRGTTWLREELLQLLTLAGTLPGTLADDMLAISALVFLLCTYLIFFALRIAREVVALRVEKIIDALFLLGLTGMVASGMVMVYTVL